MAKKKKLRIQDDVFDERFENIAKSLDSLNRAVDKLYRLEKRRMRKDSCLKDYVVTDKEMTFQECYHGTVVDAIKELLLKAEDEDCVILTTVKASINKPKESCECKECECKSDTPTAEELDKYSDQLLDEMNYHESASEELCDYIDDDLIQEMSCPEMESCEEDITIGEVKRRMNMDKSFTESLKSWLGMARDE